MDTAMKKQKLECVGGFNFNNNNPVDVLSEEIIFMILDLLNQNPLDKKSFSLACKSFYATESKHRTSLKPLRQEHLPSILCRYPNITHLDLTLCSRVTDASLSLIANACAPNLRSIDFSRSRIFSASGLLALALNCNNLVEIDLSNATDLKDSAMAAVAEAKNLEKLCLARCKSITDMGVGCVAVGCRKLRFICLKWCLGVGDLGVGLIAVKCKDIRYLNLSYLPVSNVIVVVYVPLSFPFFLFYIPLLQRIICQNFALKLKSRDFGSVVEIFCCFAFNYIQ